MSRSRRGSGARGPGAAPLATATVLLTRVPPSTPPGARFAFAANVNGWDPAKPGSFFSRARDGRHALRLRLPAGTIVQGKVTRGSWASAEADPRGGPRRNRALVVKAGAVVRFAVGAWLDRSPPRGPSLAGRIDHYPGFASPELGNTRHVSVYVPYGPLGERRRLPVVYLQDGQNVFDATVAFGGREWRADETAEAFARRGRRVLVVAVNSTPGRHSEYSPFPAPEHGSRGDGERFAAFLAHTLKPFIESRYPVRRAAAAHAVVGSSLGGLIALYAGLRHPEAFGCVGALSPALWFAGGKLQEWVEHNMPARPPRVWLDMGTWEGGSLAEAARHVQRVRDMAKLLRLGRAEVHARIVPRGRHDEDAWAARFPAFLEWFLQGVPAREPRRR